MTIVADATAATVGGTRRAAQVELRTSGGTTGSATTGLPAGLADAVVAWITSELGRLRGRSVEELIDGLGSEEARWNDAASHSSVEDRDAARAGVALVMNALWDLWAQTNECPLWKLVVNLSPEHLVRSLDLRWVEDVLPAVEARNLLETRVRGRSAREADLRREGYPVVPMVPLAHADAGSRIDALRGAGWPALRIGLSDDALDARQRGVLIQLTSGPGNRVRVAVSPDRPWSPLTMLERATELAELGVETLVEPGDPSDVVALGALRKHLGAHSGVRLELTAGDGLHSPVPVKQLLATGAVDGCRLNPARLGVSASLTLLLLAARLRVPVSFAAGAGPAALSTAGLTTALHLAAVDDIAIGASLDRRWIDLGASPDLLAAVLGGAPGRCRLPNPPTAGSWSDSQGADRPLSRTLR
ncbi:MAG: enolase C-terminal domain-like protein [Acidimicrobiia bacterium]